MTTGHASLNRLAVAATNHCLTGCAIGEVLGLVIALAAGWGSVAAVALAVAADTVSIAVMEIVDLLFWGALVLSLAIAWVVAFPVNRWLIARGRGHAVVHGSAGHGHAHH
jgi:hypothetical protein